MEMIGILLWKWGIGWVGFCSCHGHNLKFIEGVQLFRVSIFGRGRNFFFMRISISREEGGSGIWRVCEFLKKILCENFAKILCEKFAKILCEKFGKIYLKILFKFSALLVFNKHNCITSGIINDVGMISSAHNISFQCHITDRIGVSTDIYELKSCSDLAHTIIIHIEQHIAKVI